MANKHRFVHANGEVSTRTSANRIYTHAIEMTWANGAQKNVAWCGSYELAAKQLIRWNNELEQTARSYKRNGNGEYIAPTVAIVEVELIGA